MLDCGTVDRLTNQFISPPPGHSNVYIYGAEEIRRLGTNAPSVIASDEATLDELSPGPEKLRRTAGGQTARAKLRLRLSAACAFGSDALS